MGRLFFLMGKSSTGKDSIYKNLLKRTDIKLKRVVGYTTRPIRSGEKDGEDYYFCSREKMDRYLESQKVVEIRSYPTIHGDWFYFTVDDGQIDFIGNDMLMIGTLESYLGIKSYYTGNDIVPIYIEVEDGVRLQRAIDRERQQKNPKYEELCRRFLADSVDFSKEKLEQAGITRSFLNENVEKTTEEIINYIR